MGGIMMARFYLSLVEMKNVICFVELKVSVLRFIHTLFTSCSSLFYIRCIQVKYMHCVHFFKILEF